MLLTVYLAVLTLFQQGAPVAVLEPALILEAQTKVLRAYDPLLLKTALYNRGKDPIVGYSLSNMSGGLRFEIKNPHSDNFVEVRTTDFRTLEVPVRAVLNPGEKAASYDALFYDQGKFVFSLTGEYELRAKTGREWKWVSAP